MPWTRLPALRALAPEFYDTLPAHPSWPMVIVNFIRDAEVGIFARAKRLGRLERAAAAEKAARAAAGDAAGAVEGEADGSGEEEK